METNAKGPRILPLPTPEARAHAAALAERIADAIRAAGGWIGFDRYMELALYAPGLGYYVAGAAKLGPAGDFVTAPELTPLFGATLARFATAVLEPDDAGILELGAGTGALAASLLEALARAERLPRHYYILERSPELAGRARTRLAAFGERIVWLDALPARFRGLVLANELLDALPVRIARASGAAIEEAGVGVADGGLDWAYRPADATLRALLPPLDPPYTTEVAPLAQALVRTLAQMLERGVALIIDYGFPAREYYHPERSAGTLMCHYRHRAHADPFFLPGLQDITAHVDFSAIARVASEGGAALLGYTSQAGFLLDCGITEALGGLDPADPGRYLPAANAVQRLVSPAEMGELFKALAFGRGHSAALPGFGRGDRRASL